MKKTYEYLIAGVIGALISYALYSFVDIIPSINIIKNDNKEINKNIESINSTINDILVKYLKNDNEGIECKVGYSSEIKDHNISVFLNNKFDLKRGDRIELTYIYGVMRVSIECFVHFVEQSPKQSSDADFFISKDLLEIFQISKEEQNKGILDMRFKHLNNR